MKLNQLRKLSLFLLLIIKLGNLLVIWSAGFFWGWEILLFCVINALTYFFLMYLYFDNSTQNPELPTFKPLKAIGVLVTFLVYGFAIILTIYLGVTGIGGTNFLIMLGYFIIIELFSVYFWVQNLHLKLYLKNKKNTFNKLKDLASYDLEAALVKLSNELSKSSEFYQLQNDVVQSLGRLRRIKKDWDKGIISRESYDQEIAKINQAFLNLLLEITNRQHLT